MLFFVWIVSFYMFKKPTKNEKPLGVSFLPRFLNTLTLKLSRLTYKKLLPLIGCCFNVLHVLLPARPPLLFWDLAFLFKRSNSFYRVTAINVSRKWIDWAEWAASLCTANSPFPGHVYCRHPVEIKFGPSTGSLDMSQT